MNKQAQDATRGSTADPRLDFGQDGRLLGAVFLFSMFTNALMLTGPLFMLQVYDRVLGRRSEETLLALSLLVTFLVAEFQPFLETLLEAGLLTVGQGGQLFAFAAKRRKSVGPVAAAGRF